jgi:hypothetical protein
MCRAYQMPITLLAPAAHERYRISATLDRKWAADLSGLYG